MPSSKSKHVRCTLLLSPAHTHLRDVCVSQNQRPRRHHEPRRTTSRARRTRSTSTTRRLPAARTPPANPTPQGYSANTLALFPGSVANMAIFMRVVRTPKAAQWVKHRAVHWREPRPKSSAFLAFSEEGRSAPQRSWPFREWKKVKLFKDILVS